MQNSVLEPSTITGVILAGGLARRLGGIDKGLIDLAGRSMIQYVLDALSPQVAGIIINANRNQSIYRSHGYPVIGLIPSALINYSPFYTRDNRQCRIVC